MSQAADRNLLFGILAIQNDFITSDALVDSMNTWVLNKSRPIEEILVERGALDPAARDALEPMLAYQIGCHEGDASRSLGALSSLGSIQKLLTKIPDIDVQASLARIQPARALPESEPSADESLATRSPSADSILDTRLPDGKDVPAPGVRSGEPGPRFRRLKLHARGGLGEVYIAEDGELNRRVALKEIQDHHADHTDSRSRFMVEAEITGGLEHPGIFPVYSLGQYSNGRPFYAMRFIQGDSLADLIKSFHADPTFKTDPGKRAVALQKMLRRFLDVCNAIAYAHSRGVLHRDLKPGNVMVGKYGETLVVDWGLAKFLGTSETHVGDESPLMPTSGSGVAATIGVLGTPAYMPPEQAAGDLDALGPASDVYSLGASLYQMHTNQVPFRGTSVHEILERVKSGDFPSPRSIDPGIPKGLEAICLKAMATRIEARYPTPLALAADIEHWLADEPVSAFPEPLPARLARWARRHRSAALAAAVSLFVITGVASVAFVVVSRALGEKTQALDAESAALAAKTKALDAETAANAKTRAAFNSAKATIDEFVKVVREDARLRDDKALRPFRDELIEKALTYTLGFIDKYEDDPLLAAEVADAYFNAGKLQEQIGRKVDALRAFEESLRVRETLGRERRDDEFQGALARTLTNLGLLQSLTARSEAAERSYARALELFESLVKRNPEATTYVEGLALALHNLGYLQSDVGRNEDAEQSLARAIGILEPLVKANPEVTSFANGLANTLNDLGDLQNRTNRAADAERSSERAREIGEMLVRRNPSLVEFRSVLGVTFHNLGESQRTLSHRNKAVGAFKAAIEHQKEAVATYPKNPEYRGFLLAHHQELAKTYRMFGQTEDLGEAVAANRERRKLSRGDAPELYKVACEFSFWLPFVSPAQTADRAKYADEAIDTLSETVRAGWSNFRRTANDAELALLHGRADFRALLLEMMDRAFPADPFRFGPRP